MATQQNISRTPTNMFGTPASPSSVAGGGNTSGTVDMTIVEPTGGTGGASACLVVVAVITGATAPTTAITVTCSYTLDGTNYLGVQPLSISAPANSTTYPFSFVIPAAAKGAKITVVNGATNAITTWAQGSVLTSSLSG